MSDLIPFSKSDKLAELKRELEMRRQVYPRQIDAKRMSKVKAERQIGIIEAIIKDYES